MRIFLAILAAVGVLSACSTTRESETSTAVSTVSASAAAPSPTTTIPPVTAATATSAPAVSTPAATAVPSTTASASALPAVAPLLPPDAPPQIVSVNLDKNIVRGGDTISGSVTTSSNVASVEARVATYSIPVPKTGVGTFSLSYVVPSIPFFLHRTYTMTIIARNARGDTATTAIPLTIR